MTPELKSVAGAQAGCGPNMYREQGLSRSDPNRSGSNSCRYRRPRRLLVPRLLVLVPGLYYGFCQKSMGRQEYLNSVQRL